MEMAFINDLGKKISKSSQGAYTKTKLGVKLAEKEKHLNNLYLELGKAFYQWTVGNDYPELFKSQISEIGEQLSFMDELSVERDKIKGLTKCPVCDASIPIDSSFCIHCGSKIEHPENFCESCGAKLPDNALFCVFCGAKIDSSELSYDSDKCMDKEG